MAEASESSTTTVASGAAGPAGLNRALAWVGITAGAVFIVAVIFFTGAFVAGGEHPFRHHHGMYGPGGPGGPEGMVVFPGPFPPGMGPGWPGGPMMPGPFGPGMGPGGGHGGGRGGPPTP